MTIYKTVGGAPGVAVVVDGFYRRVLADPRLAGYFAGTDMQHLKRHMRAFLNAAFGGPYVYGGRDMAAAHAGLGITGADFDAVAGHLVETLTELGVPPFTISQIAATLTSLRPGIVTGDGPRAA